MQEAWVGWEDPLEKERETHSSFSAWEIPMDGGACWTTVRGVTKSQAGLSGRAHRHMGLLQALVLARCYGKRPD